MHVRHDRQVVHPFDLLQDLQPLLHADAARRCRGAIRFVKGRLEIEGDTQLIAETIQGLRCLHDDLSIFDGARAGNEEHKDIYDLVIYNVLFSPPCDKREPTELSVCLRRLSRYPAASSVRNRTSPLSADGSADGVPPYR